MSQPDVAEPISMPGAVLTCSSTSGAQKRGSNFGRVDALRWWLKLRHEGAPACPGACFQAQKSKRKPHERDMRDNLEVAVTRVSEWATEEISRLPEGHESRAKLITILEELPRYGSPEFEDFNEINLVPLLRGLKEGTIGRKHKESEGLMQTNPQRAQKTQETLEAMALQLLHKINSLYEDAQRMSTDDPAKASRVAKLLSKQLLEIHKLSGSAELPADFMPPVVRMASLAEGARAASALLTYAAEQADRAGDGDEGASEGYGEDEEMQSPMELAQVRGGVAAALACASPVRLSMTCSSGPLCESASDAVSAGWRSASQPEAGAQTGARLTTDPSGAGLPCELATYETSDSQASLVGYLQGMSSQEYGELGLVQSQDSQPPEAHEPELPQSRFQPVLQIPEPQEAVEHLPPSSRASPCTPSQPSSRPPSQASSQPPSLPLSQPLPQLSSQPHSQLQSHPPSRLQSLPCTQLQWPLSSQSQPLSQPPYPAALAHHAPLSLIHTAPCWPSPQPSLPVAHVARVLGVIPHNTTVSLGVAPPQMPWSRTKAEPPQQVLDRLAPTPSTTAPSKPTASPAIARESASAFKPPRNHGGNDIMDAANGLRALSSLTRKPEGGSEVTEIAACVEGHGPAA